MTAMEIVQRSLKQKGLKYHSFEIMVLSDCSQIGESSDFDIFQG